MLWSPRPILMAIVGPGAAGVRGALQGGADLIQVRAAQLPTKSLLSLARGVMADAGGGDQVIINSRPDVAELLGARGVHLPESGLDPSEVRRAFPGLLIGVSRHDRAGLLRAVDQGADYAILGPVFDTPSKEARALGLVRFQDAIRDLAIPVIGVGGVTPANARDLLRCGASGVAAIRPFVEPLSALAQAVAFRDILDSRDAGD